MLLWFKVIKLTCLLNMGQLEKPPLLKITHRWLDARNFNIQVSTLPFLQRCFHAFLVFSFSAPLLLSPLPLFPVRGVKPWWYTYRSFFLFVLILFVTHFQRAEDSLVRFFWSARGEMEEKLRSGLKHICYMWVSGTVRYQSFASFDILHFWAFETQFVQERFWW